MDYDININNEYLPHMKPEPHSGDFTRLCNQTMSNCNGIFIMFALSLFPLDDATVLFLGNIECRYLFCGR